MSKSAEIMRKVSLSQQSAVVRDAVPRRVTVRERAQPVIGRRDVLLGDDGPDLQSQRGGRAPTHRRANTDAVAEEERICDCQGMYRSARRKEKRKDEPDCATSATRTTLGPEPEPHLPDQPARVVSYAHERPRL